jgi:hypothetical protein
LPAYAPPSWAARRSVALKGDDGLGDGRGVGEPPLHIVALAGLVDRRPAGNI